MAIRSDRSVSIRESVHDVKFTLVLTVVLVVLVIFLFLRNLSATIIPSLALPFSIVGTFAIMWALNYSLDNLSLMALTLSVGFVVDDAIVMLENIVRHMEMGKPRMQAALDGSKEIAFTIISMTVSLAAVFIPILFMGGIVGRLMHEFAVTIGAAILVSGLVSLTLTPMLCSRFLQAAALDEARLVLQRDREGVRRVAQELRVDAEADDPLQGRDDGRLGAAAGRHRLPVRHRAEGLHPERRHRPDQRRRRVRAGRRLRHDRGAHAPDDGDPAERSERRRVHRRLGRRPPEHRSEAARQRTGKTADMIIEELRPKLNRIPGVRVSLTNPPAIRIGGGPGGGRGGGGAYQIALQDPDTEELYRVAPQFEANLREIPGLQDVNSDLQLRTPQLSVDLDREQIAALGLTVDQVQSALSSAYSARQVSQIFAPDDEYQVMMQVAPEFQQNPAALSMLYVQGSGGQLIPLSSVVTTRQTVGPQSINHIGQLPVGDAVVQPAARRRARRRAGARAGDGAPDAAGDRHRDAAGHGAGVRGVDARPRLDSARSRSS